ncbi:DUF1877 family protein [Streptomyces sp. NPDC001544]|uniref:DUF1877 family protein n=1 Tax=Streptomyces sp. NPDC001544 TaxID=3364584 RepID=UPI0036AF5E80
MRSLERLFQDDWETVRGRIDRRREEVLDQRYLDHELLYASSPPHLGEDGPHAQVVLGGRPVFHSALGTPPFLLLTPAETAAVAAFLASADFTALWHGSRADLLPWYGGPAAEPQTRGAFAAAHRGLKEFYARASDSGEAVVKWLQL